MWGEGGEHARARAKTKSVVYCRVRGGTTIPVKQTHARTKITVTVTATPRSVIIAIRLSDAALQTRRNRPNRHGPDNCGTSVGGVLLYRYGGTAAGIRRGGGRGRSCGRRTETLDGGGQEQKMVYDFRRQLEQQEHDR